MSSPPPPPVVSPPPVDVMWLPEFESSPWVVDDLADVDADALAPSPSSDSDSPVEEERMKRSRANALAVRRRRAYRSRKKCEARGIQALNAALTARRDELLARHEARRRQLLDATNGNARRFAGGWRGVAARQLQRRIDAERLNRELRVQLRQTYKEAEQLARSLASQLSLVDMQRLSTLLSTQQHKEKLRFSERDMPIVKDLAKEVVAILGQADAVLSQCEPPAITSTQAYSYSHRWRRDPESRGEYLKLVESRRVPFGFDVALSALEKTVVLMFATQCEPAVLRLPGNMIAIKFSKSGVDAEHRRTRRFESIYVGKMIVEGDRAALCWRCVSGEQAASNQIQETGWGMVRRERPTDSSIDSGTSFTYVSRIDAPTKEMAGPASDSELKRFVEMAPSTEEETIVWYQAMESVVMQGRTIGLNAVT